MDSKSRLMGVSVAALMSIGAAAGASAGELRTEKDAAFANDFAILVPAAQISGAIQQFESNGVELTESLADAQEFYSESLGRVQSSVNQGAQKAINYHIDTNKSIGAKDVAEGKWSLEGLEAVSDFVMQQHQVIGSAQTGARDDMVNSGVAPNLAQSISVEMMASAIQPEANMSSYEIIAATQLRGEALSGLSAYQDVMNASVNSLDNVGPQMQATFIGDQSLDVKASFEQDYNDVFNMSDSSSDVMFGGDEDVKRETADITAARIAVNTRDGVAVDADPERIAIKLDRERLAVEPDRDRVAVDLDRERIAVEPERDRVAVELDRPKTPIELKRERIAIALDRQRIPIELDSDRVAKAEAIKQRAAENVRQSQTITSKSKASKGNTDQEL